MRFRTALVLSLIICSITPAGGQSASGRQPAGAARKERLSAAFPEIERLFTTWLERQHVPGAAFGLIIDGELAWVKTAGVVDTTTRTAVTPDSVFRIASMTKSLTALAILKLRDEGRLSLDDPAAKHVPELSGLAYPTTDSPAITIRHLLTHSEGFPEDNPWGDRQLAQSDETMTLWLKQGIPFSTPPGTEFEYSNYGFAILGRIVERVSRQPYDQYMAKNVFGPLGLTASTFEGDQIDAAHRARGYRWEDGRWIEELAPAHGSFGAMGGLWMSLRDLARYVTYQMSAWPPRDEAEAGPVRRSSLREQQQPARWQRARATRAKLGDPLELSASAYGYGLRITQTCRFRHIVSHGGGLPGYGSLMMWLPDHDVGLVAMANVTYASWGGLFTEALGKLAATGALRPRPVAPSAALLQASREISALVTRWDAQRASVIVADNFFMDLPAERWAERLTALRAAHGACRAAGDVDAENALRGKWRMNCDRGWLRVSITLAPTMPPRIQYLQVHSTLPPGPAMSAAIAASHDRIAADAAAWGACQVGEAIGGDGVRVSSVRLDCEKGTLVALYRLDDAERLESLTLSPAPDQACVP